MEIGVRPSIPAILDRLLALYLLSNANCKIADVTTIRSAPPISVRNPKS
jgi:hypothetical protein